MRKKPDTPPTIPDEPYANVRVDEAAHFVVVWGLGWSQHGMSFTRSVARAVRIRDRRLGQMTSLYERKQLAERAIRQQVDPDTPVRST